MSCEKFLSLVLGQCPKRIAQRLLYPKPLRNIQRVNLSVDTLKAVQDRDRMRAISRDASPCVTIL